MFDAKKIASYSLWTSGQAICYLLGVTPEQYLANKKNGEITCFVLGVPYEQCKVDKKNLEENYKHIKKILELDVMAGLINPDYIKEGVNNYQCEYFKPKSIIDWGLSKDIKVERKLINAINKAVPNDNLIESTQVKNTKNPLQELESWKEFEAKALLVLEAYPEWIKNEQHISLAGNIPDWIKKTIDETAIESKKITKCTTREVEVIKKFLTEKYNI
jgi:hypothetical protein